MSTRWLVIVVACVFVVVLAVTLALSGGDEATVPVASPSAMTSPDASPPASPSASPSSYDSASPSPNSSPSPSPSASPAASFACDGDLVDGWYWLRDDAHRAAATWEFAALPETGDLVFIVEVLATDAVNGAAGQAARFFFAWAPSLPADPSGWSGRLPVTLANVSPADDPVGYTCRGTVTVPRWTVAGATTLVVRIGRDDVRGEVEPSDVHVAVRASSVALRFP
jgi:hypothetical protein